MAGGEPAPVPPGAPGTDMDVIACEPMDTIGRTCGIMAG